MSEQREQNRICIKGRVNAKREGMYTTYVIENLEAISPYDVKYVMCTQPPNWQTGDLEIGQEGYLNYEFVQAGRDCWYNKDTAEFVAYQYTAHYFIDFVPITHIINGGRVVEKGMLVMT